LDARSRKGNGEIPSAIIRHYYIPDDGAADQYLNSGAWLASPLYGHNVTHSSLQG
jgi:hypothetical protein